LVGLVKEFWPIDVVLMRSAYLVDVAPKEVELITPFRRVLGYSIDLLFGAGAFVTSCRIVSPPTTSVLASIDHSAMQLIRSVLFFDGPGHLLIEIPKVPECTSSKEVIAVNAQIYTTGIWGMKKRIEIRKATMR